MLDESVIRKRLKELEYRHLKKSYESNLKRRPRNCKWNACHEFVDMKTFEKKTLGICMYSTVHPGVITTDVCETAVVALKCPCFELKKSKELIKLEIMSELNDKEALNTKYKDIRELKIVLGELKDPPLNWWQRFKLLFVKKA